MSESFVYLNGQIVPAAEATVSVFDTGLLHGASVFTTLLARNGKGFRLDRHLDRLTANAHKIGLRHDATRDKLTAAVAEVLDANSLSDARVRITLTPGAVGQGQQTTTIVTAVPFRNEPRWYDEGIDVIVSQIRQHEADPTTGVKTGCYLTRVMARQAANAVGADEALWFTLSGHLAEACYCNVFCVRDGALLTPPLDTPVLAGIVREAVIELAAKLAIPCTDDAPITSEQVRDAHEMFLTSSVAGVRPVVRVRRRGVGDEKPGPVTRRVMDAYERLLNEEC